MAAKRFRFAAMVLICIALFASIPRFAGAEEDAPDAPCDTTYDYEKWFFPPGGGNPVFVFGHTGTEPDPESGYDVTELENVKTHSANIYDQTADDHKWLWIFKWHKNCTAN